MDIQLLRTFLELDRTRHFGKAAEALFVTQSAVSARIRLLEETLGVPLFIRRRNEIQLTSAGARLKRHAETIVAAWQRALTDTALDEERKTALSVGGVYGLWDCFLPQWIHSLYHHRPDIALQAEAHGPEMLIKKVADGVLDVAFVFEAANLEQLVVSEVASIPLLMVAARPGLDARSALKEGYVMVEWGSSFTAACARHFPDAPLPSMRLNIGNVAMAFILECGGSGYLPDQLVAEHLKAGRLYKVDNAPVIDRRVYAVYQAHGERRGFVEEALAYLKANTLPQAVHSSSVM
jgi:LysR family transcriptional regulator, flagellar master operon regulator